MKTLIAFVSLMAPIGRRYFSPILIAITIVFSESPLGVASEPMVTLDSPDGLARLSRLSVEAELKWRTNHTWQYFETMTSINRELLGTNIIAVGKSKLFKDVVQKVLEKSPINKGGVYDSTLFYQQLRMMDLLLESETPIEENKNAFANARLLYCKALLTYSVTLRHRSISNYVVKDVSINVLPPVRTAQSNEIAAAGTDPRFLQNTTVRAEYEKRIAENSKAAAANAEQRDVERFLSDYEPRISDYVAKEYSKEPRKPDELESLLSTSGCDGQTTGAVLSRVRQLR